MKKSASISESEVEPAEALCDAFRCSLNYGRFKFSFLTVCLVVVMVKVSGMKEVKQLTVHLACLIQQRLTCLLKVIAAVRMNHCPGSKRASKAASAVLRCHCWLHFAGVKPQSVSWGRVLPARGNCAVKAMLFRLLLEPPRGSLSSCTCWFSSKIMKTRFYFLFSAWVYFPRHTLPNIAALLLCFFAGLGVGVKPGGQFFLNNFTAVSYRYHFFPS